MPLTACHRQLEYTGVSALTSPSGSALIDFTMATSRDFIGGEPGEGDPLVVKNVDIEISDKNFHDDGTQRKDGKVHFGGAFINTLKCSLGAGILGFPYAIRKAGWLGGIVGCTIVSLSTGFGMQIVHRVGQEVTPEARTLEKYRKQEYLEFVDIARLASGKWAARAAWWAVVVGQIGVCITYVIFVTNNLQSSVFAPSFPRWGIVLCEFPVLLLLSFIGSLKKLLPLAMVGLVLLFIGIVFILNYGVRNPGFPREVPVVDANGIVVAVGIAIFAMESVTNVPALVGSMKKPEHFPAVLNVVIVTMLVLYVAFGMVGAMAFGSGTQSVITRDIPIGTLSGVGSRVALVFYILATYPFQMFPLAQTLDRSFGVDSKDGDSNTNSKMHVNAEKVENLEIQKPKAASYYLIRLALVFGTTIIAIWISDCTLLLLHISVAMCTTFLD